MLLKSSKCIFIDSRFSKNFWIKVVDKTVYFQNVQTKKTKYKRASKKFLLQNQTTKRSWKNSDASQKI